MALTPDGSRLIVANRADNSIALIDPDNPSNSQAVALPAAIGSTGPMFVAATSTGKVLINTIGAVGMLYELDLSTLKVAALTIKDVLISGNLRLSGTADGSTILLRGGPNGLWNDSKQQFTPIFQNYAGSGLGSAAGDGNVFAVGEGFIAPDGKSLTAVSIPDEMGGFGSWEENDAALTVSGSLEFAPGRTEAFAPPGLFILDTHHGEVLGNLVLPNLINPWTTTVAVDAIGQHCFMVDPQGLTVLTLAAPPLAVGWINPSVASTSGSTSIVIRGSGFQNGTTVNIGGEPATSVFVDANTLQVIAPAHAAGAAQVIVQNPDGESYRLDAGLVYQ